MSINPYNSSIKQSLRDLWECICSIQQGGDSPVVTSDSATITFTGNGTTGSPLVATYIGGTPPTGANPSAFSGLAPVNGVATTYMRSDAAPGISQSIVPLWTGAHTFSAATTMNGGATVNGGALTVVAGNSFSTVGGGAITGSGTLSITGAVTLTVLAGSGSRMVVADATGILSTQAIVIGANPSASLGLTAINGAATTFMRSDAAPALNQAIAPVWTGAHTFTSTGSLLIPGLGLKNAAPILDIWNTAATTDQKRWGFSATTGGGFILRAYGDDGTTSNSGIAIQAFRNGTQTDTVEIWATGVARVKVESTKVSVSIPIILSPGYTVATLPAASAALKGARAFVTDASSATPTFMSAVAGGGTAAVSVFCDGTSWLYG